MMRLRGAMFVFVAFGFMFFSSEVHAQETDGCSIGSLQGSYGFRMTGTPRGASAYALVGRLVSDGKGKFTVVATEALSDLSVRGAKFSGTYEVNADCTGSALFLFANGDQVHLDFVLVDEGRQIFIIVSDTGPVESGVAVKIAARKHAAKERR